MKLKLKPSARMNRRYLLLKAKGKEQVEKVILEYIGVLGWARATPFFVSTENGKVVLAVDRKSVENVRAAFEMSKEEIKVERVSGTLKGLEK